MNTDAPLQRLTGWRLAATRPRVLPDCSLVVPTWKRPGAMVILLETLRELPDPPGEVVVVDGSPDEAVREAVTAWTEGADTPFDLVYISSAAGLTRQRNVGIDAAGGEYVFYLDDDCLPEPEYFRAIREIFVKDSIRAIGAVRGFITNGVEEPVPLLWRLRAALRIVDKPEAGKYYPTGMTWTWNQVSPFVGTRSIDVLAGGAAAYRREVFEKCRFSEFFGGYSAGEDLEMSRRVAHDWSLVVCGDALVNHHHVPESRPAGFAFGRMAIRNRFFVWRRHSPDVGVGVWFKFWLDQVLIGGGDLMRFFRKPWQGTYLLRFLGTVCGGLECWVLPPRYEEPPARREYEFELVDLRSVEKN